MGMVQVQIDGLAMDLVSNSPVVVLASEELNKVLPIWIGHNEAWVIAMEISGVGAKRPLTHDLCKRVIEKMGGDLEKVEITELKEQTFYAKLYIKQNGTMQEIDARPSDSIALALKTDSPIFVNEELFQISKEDAEEGEEGKAPPQLPTDPETLKDRLKKINPEDFGKYSL